MPEARGADLQISQRNQTQLLIGNLAAGLLARGLVLFVFHLVPEPPISLPCGTSRFAPAMLWPCLLAPPSLPLSVSLPAFGGNCSPRLGLPQREIAPSPLRTPLKIVFKDKVTF